MVYKTEMRGCINRGGQIVFWCAPQQSS